jgi:hypothetical protein
VTVDGFAGTIAPCAVTVEAVVPLAASLSLYESPDETTTKITSVKEGSAARPLFLTLENIPSGKSIDDYTFTWPQSNANYEIGDYGPDIQSYKKFFTPVNPGSYDISVKVLLGEQEITTCNLMITVEADYSKYTEIKTPDDFVSKVMKSTSGANKFALGANIDLGGINTDGAKNNVSFNGVLDGRGYTVKNFNANPADNGTNGGLFLNVMANAAIRNTHFIGTMNQTAGFGGLLCREMMGTVEDCIFEGESTVDTSGFFDWTWCRSGIVAGMLKGTIRNSVVCNLSTNAQVLDTTAYAGISSDGPVLIDNVYTAGDSTEASQHVLPFNPDPSQAWCGVANVKNLHDKMDFAASVAADYDLTGSYWKLEDGKMPVLTHDADDFASFAPAVSATASSKTLKVGGDNATVTLSTKHFKGDVAYSASASLDGIVTATNNQDGTFTIAPVAEGETTLTFTATAGEESAAADVKFTVEAAGAITPTYDIPENATKISDKASFLAYFDGGAANTSKNAYLDADIDLGGDALAMRMAGEYNAIFEGCGHTVSNYTQSGQSLINIMGTTSELRNVRFECDGQATSGFGTVAFQNNGKMKNVDVEVTVTGSINNWGPMALATGGTFEDCDSTIHMAAAAATSNSLFHIARQDGTTTFTNCTYFVDGEGTAASFLADPTGVTARTSL